MTYALVYKDSGDFIADFESLDRARSAAQDLLEGRPSMREHIGLMEFDDAGHPTRSHEIESATLG
jgi:hypothetical protein